jgi:hypothetical protein
MRHRIVEKAYYYCIRTGTTGIRSGQSNASLLQTIASVIGDI